MDGVGCAAPSNAAAGAASEAARIPEERGGVAANGLGRAGNAKEPAAASSNATNAASEAACILEEVSGSSATASGARAPRRRWLPLAVVVLVAASQVTATQLTKSVQDNLAAPFFVMYVHTSMMALCLPAAKVLAPRGERVRAALRQAVPFLLLWVASLYCFTYALKLAPAGLVQTLFGTAPAVVTLLSRAALGELLTVRRATAVALALMGAAAVSSRGWGSGGTPGKVLAGSIFSLAAVFAAACYKVRFKVCLGEPPAFAVLGFVGTLGLVAIVVEAPVTLGLSALGLEDRWWSTSVNWPLLLGGGAIDVVYSTAVTYGLSISSPVFVALGTILASPANLAVDAVVRGDVPTAAEVCGAVIIALSFALLSTEGH